MLHPSYEDSPSLNTIVYLPTCESTNAYAKAHFEDFGAVGAVYTTSQTAGRGRLGRTWENAAGEGFYYTAIIAEPLAEAATLPLLASLSVCELLQKHYGITCQIKWPNDILLNGKKICGILCESVSYGYENAARGIVCGLGINLAQSAAYFIRAQLPHASSLALQGVAATASDAPMLAASLTDFGFDKPLYTFARTGFAPYRDAYKAACINLGKEVTFDLPGGKTGTGIATDIDERGQLVVQTPTGETKVFTGEVSVKGIYEAQV